ncbi:hypothetical protein Acr_12g0009590 [Actinidia rufa]|uniref:Uncharacterized protein n=1 Tax=Actinidia rufa TaxID=165716 RepID=A0A7J0FI92_9ERIC|nr:hypothetical protein Acr_12g0009590 [Actinidia rufa]
MDLWVVAAVTGAGYLAKHWKNLSGESDSSSGNSIPMQSESNIFSTTGISGKSDVLDSSGDFLPEFKTTRLTKSKALIRSRRTHIKPLNSTESCLTESVFSSLPSPLTPTLRPLLVTDGKTVISAVGSDLCGVKDDGKEFRLKGKVGVLLGENSDTMLGTYSSKKISSVELPRKPEQRRGKGRLSNSHTIFSGGPFCSQGSSNGMLLFFIGITIGIMKQSIARPVTRKQLCLPPNGYQRECTKHNSKELDDDKVENGELMSKIEAELEAELERLELNMKASTLERISDFVELDPDFEADVIHGDLKVDLMMQLGGAQSESDSNVSGTSTNHTHTANYAISPRELSLRLHEVIESRLEARILELEAALQNSQNKVYSREWQRLVSPRGLAHGEVGSSSTLGSPIFANEVPEVDRPFVINLSGEALDAYNKAYEEIIRVMDTDEDTPDAACGNNHFAKEISRSLTLNEDNDELLIRQIVEKSRQGCSLVLHAN